MFSSFSQPEFGGLPARANFNITDLVRPKPEPPRFSWQEWNSAPLRFGDTLSIASVYKVNPERRETSGARIAHRLREADIQDAYDDVNSWSTRLDVLYGMSLNRPDTAARIGDTVTVRRPVKAQSPLWDIINPEAVTKEILRALGDPKNLFKSHPVQVVQDFLSREERERRYAELEMAPSRSLRP